MAHVQISEDDRVQIDCSKEEASYLLHLLGSGNGAVVWKVIDDVLQQGRFTHVHELQNRYEFLHAFGYDQLIILHDGLYEDIRSEVEPRYLDLEHGFPWGSI